MVMRIAPLLLILPAACSTPDVGPEPSLAPRAAEAIDPRVPIPGDVPPGQVTPELAARLEELVATVKAGAGEFEARAAEASRLAAAAGPSASESWIAAQQSLSRLVSQYGVTTRAAADIDELAASRLKAQGGIIAADREAIAAAAAEVGAINQAQAATIARLRETLAR
jgi:hypothetical protein